jgi:hypothetical protein
VTLSQPQHRAVSIRRPQLRPRTFRVDTYVPPYLALHLPEGQGSNPLLAATPVARRDHPHPILTPSSPHAMTSPLLSCAFGAPSPGVPTWGGGASSCCEKDHQSSYSTPSCTGPVWPGWGSGLLFACAGPEGLVCVPVRRMCPTAKGAQMGGREISVLNSERACISGIHICVLGGLWWP